MAKDSNITGGGLRGPGSYICGQTAVPDKIKLHIFKLKYNFEDVEKLCLLRLPFIASDSYCNT